MTVESTLTCLPEFENVKGRPILKWAGGKQQLLPHLLSRVPQNFNQYIEPFVGGGALFFTLNPGKAIISDSNPELINVYNMAAHHVEGLIKILRTLKVSKDTYYKFREQDTSQLSDIEKAARTIYLNRTCFNGLYRVNKKGQFNVPYGKHKNPKVCYPEELRAASHILKRCKILCGDYKDVLSVYAKEGDFIYIDPPYLPVSKYSDFKRYTKEQFYEEDHMELAKEVDRLHQLGCHVLLTGSNHPLIFELYNGFKMEILQTRRNINKDGKKRTGEDVIIYVPPRRRFLLRIEPPPLKEQVKKYPSTRYMGSKQNILPYIRQVASEFDFQSVLDPFSGSGIVSYMFKAHHKQVFSNDFMAMSAAYACAMVENSHTMLSDKEVEELLDQSVETDHFVEGLACDWKGVEIQQHTKTKKFKSYPSPFSSRIGAHDAFDKLFSKFQESILLVSYSSNSLPTKEEILALMSKYKTHVELVSINYRYSFANQGHNAANNKVQEYIFVGY